jgi:hypothetical protein
VSGPRHFVAGTIGNGGRFWYLTAIKLNGDSLGYSNAQMHVGVLDATGAGPDVGLPRTGSGSDDVAPRIAVGAGDGVWLDSQGYVLRVDRVPGA